MGTDDTVGIAGGAAGAEAEGAEMPVRVVIAEDEWLVAAALRSQVERCGYEVVRTVATGAEALEACQQECPDLVFMDVQMPVKDGLSATREIMEHCPTCVVIVTGRRQLDQEARQAGAMCYVVKPLLGPQIPTVVEAARQRFARFREVQSGAASAGEAMETWRAIQRAVGLLVGRDSVTEEGAYAWVWQRAEDRRCSLRAAAEEVAGELTQ